MPEQTLSYHERLAEIRCQHPRAYLPWTAEEEQTLLHGFRRGESMAILTSRLQRQPGEIRSRLRKLREAEEPPFFNAPIFYSVVQPSILATNNNSIQSSPISKFALRQPGMPLRLNQGNPYRFPSPVSYYMLTTYPMGCVYRWSIYQPNVDEPYALYIGSTKQLCPERLEGYLNPHNSATNRRIHGQLNCFINNGCRVTIEILDNGQIALNDLALDFLDFSTQRDRLFIENMLLSYYRLQGWRLLNL